MRIIARTLWVSRLIALCAGILAITLLSACSHHNDLVGTWQGQMGNLGQFTIQFKPDGTMSQTSNGGMVTITGTYSTSGDSLSTSEDSASVMGRTVPLPPGSGVPANCKYTVKGSTLTLSYGSNSTILTRVK